ncbi:unnamed protein product [Adineta ricciae]|uniref:Tetraspanin n=1 Tax=Adineta ricciae TaxID=249248 RepID=A0A813ZDQ5_ADIRI|nr:unnamed protein product [Adineta ricciae]CAF1054675.1 unnamed protein product [Adineta ricciae]
MSKSTFKFCSKLAVLLLCVLGFIELGLALWTVLDPRYRSLAYNLADVGYMDLWILRYLSLCLFASSIITLVMCLVLVWGLCSTHAFLFIASTMIVIIAIGEFTISILTFANKYQSRVTLIEQLPKLVITYRQGTDERAKRALDILQYTFSCCGADGRLGYQNNVPSSCNMFSVGCLNRTLYFLDSCMDALAYVLLFFSLIKFFIVIFFYSFLCMHYRSRQSPPMYNSSTWRPSTSLDPSPRKQVLPPRKVDHDDNHDRYTEQRRSQSNEYHKSSHENITTSIVPSTLTNKDLAEYYERQFVSRKLSSISERTEKTETDESEPDLLRLKYNPSNRKATTSTVQENFQLSVVPPKKTPIIKARRKPTREDENDHDSGVERSSSEKSFDDHSNLKLYTEVPALPPKSKQVNNNNSSSLSFSNVFITSVSESQLVEDELKRPLVHTSSHRSRSKDSITPKPILKKPSRQTSPLRIPADYYNQKKSSSIYSKTSPLLKNAPKPNPRMSLKQHNSLL